MLYGLSAIAVVNLAEYWFYSSVTIQDGRSFNDFRYNMLLFLPY